MRHISSRCHGGTITRRGMHTASVAGGTQRQQLDRTRTTKAARDNSQTLRSSPARKLIRNFASQRHGRCPHTAREAGGERRWRPTAPATRPHPRVAASDDPGAQRGGQATSECKISLHSATADTHTQRGRASVAGGPERQSRIHLSSRTDITHRSATASLVGNVDSGKR